MIWSVIYIFPCKIDLPEHKSQIKIIKFKFIGWLKCVGSHSWEIQTFKSWKYNSKTDLSCVCQFKSDARRQKLQNGEIMLHELSVQAVSDTAVLAKVKRSNHLLGMRAKRCQDGLGPEWAWCKQSTLREYNANYDNSNSTEPCCADKNRKCMYVYRLYKLYCSIVLAVLCLMH